MRYNIIRPIAPAMPNLGKGTECIKLLLSQASKDMHAPLFPMFFPRFALMWAMRNFSIPTSFVRNCAPKWPIWWLKAAVTRANCRIWCRLSVTISGYTTSRSADSSRHGRRNSSFQNDVGWTSKQYQLNGKTVSVESSVGGAGRANDTVKDNRGFLKTTWTT